MAKPGKPSEKRDKKRDRTGVADRPGKADKAGKPGKAGKRAKDRVAGEGERQAPPPVEPTTVDFWFDPMCPWAWITSRWMAEVELVRPVKTIFHVMSLGELNADRDVSEDYRRSTSEGWPAVRVALAVKEQYGQEQLASFYTAIGTRIHIGKEGKGRGTIEAALADVGLPIELAELGETGDNDDALRRSHYEGMDLVGSDVGTPVIKVGDAAIFGPVVTPRPRGEQAGQIFDAVVRLASYPGFYELKRSRLAKPAFD